MSAEPSKDDAKSKAGEKQDEFPLAGMPLRKPVGKTSAPPPENNEENPQQETWQQKHSRTEIRIQKAILAFAVIACWVYYRQLEEMGNATNEATKATNIAQQSLRLDERAWISVLPTGISMEEGKEFVVTLEVKNIGKTPAKAVQALSAGQFRQEISGTEKVMVTPSTQIVTSDTNPDFGGEDAYLAEHGSPVFLVPQAPFATEYHSGAFTLDKEAIENIKSGHAKIFTWGKVTYADIFGVSHWLTFCVVFDGHAFSLWKEHNDCDDNQ